MAALAGMRSALAAYTRIRTSHPLAADSGTAGLLFLGGDLLCQTIEKKHEDAYDLKRTARMTFFGMAVMGPAAYYWYHFLDKRFPSKDVRVVLQKVAVDQLVFSPPYYAAFYFIMPLLEGKSPADGIANVKKNFVTTYIADLIVWPPAQVVNFRYFPPERRVMFVSSGCVYFGTPSYLGCSTLITNTHRKSEFPGPTALAAVCGVEELTQAGLWDGIHESIAGP